MSLTTNEKKILGYMTDSGQLVGDQRVAVGADDTYAREVIAEYKARIIPVVQGKIANYEACVAIEQEKLDTLQA